MRSEAPPCAARCRARGRGWGAWGADIFIAGFGSVVKTHLYLIITQTLIRSGAGDKAVYPTDELRGGEIGLAGLHVAICQILDRDTYVMSTAYFRLEK